MTLHCNSPFRTLGLGAALLLSGLGLLALATQGMVAAPGWTLYLWALGFLVVTPLGLLALAVSLGVLLMKGMRECLCLPVMERR